MRRALLVCLLACATVAGEEALDAAVAAKIAPALARAADPAFDLSELHAAAVQKYGTVVPLIEHVETLARDEEDAARKRALLWLAGRSRRILGDLEEALAHFEALVEAGDASPHAWLHLAQLLDATGKQEKAREAYEKTLASAADDALRARIRLRMAMLGTGKKKGKTLAEHAARENTPSDVRNRAAVVLALLGQPEESTKLFVVDGEGTERFRGELRLAQWQLEAKQPEKAQDAAWRALQAAKLARDRRYALAILVEAHRKSDALPRLAERFAQTPDLSAEARRVWIDLLRELDRVDEAMRLFREGAGGQFTVEMRRELLEMCREAGRDKMLEAAYREVMATEPERLEWPEGLSRHLLEQGRPQEAAAIWSDYLERTKDPERVLAAAGVLMDLGMDDEATRFADRAMQDTEARYLALLFLCDLHRNRGRMAKANEVLTKLEELAPPAHRARLWLAEAYERLGRKKRAADVLVRLRTARGEAESEEDLDMRLAVLLSEVGEEEKALAIWRELWRKVNSIPRRRYVEDRMLTVAARLGQLADVAIELERKMSAGTADERDSGLLVRLYTTANDPVSAAEILEEYVKRSGAGEKKTLAEKARVYITCADYHSYDKTVRKLMRVDPEGAPDYLRQLAMSALERGAPSDARKTLEQLKKLERGADGAEFEAGVLALAGLNEDAIAAYRRGLARFPDRIETYLLLANLMSQSGRKDRAVGMFQHLAETAEKDDLFTIAIDGLLNLDPGKAVMEWARRIILERLAGRHDKMYLYQLLSDIAEELGDRPGMLGALENSLPIAGSRRASLLRELMELAKGTQSGSGVVIVIIGGVAQVQQPQPLDSEKRLAYGRRLLHLGDLVPPDVYLGLGEAFLQEDQVTAAAKTFGLAREVPDYYVFRRQVAQSFERAGYPDEALRVYGSVLIGQSGDVALIAKVGELHEGRGRDPVAQGLFRRAMDLMLSRRPFAAVKEEERKDDDDIYVWRSGNVEEFDQHYDRVLRGSLATHEPGADVERLLKEQRARIDEDLARAAKERPEEKEKFTLRRYPRVLYRAQFFRRVAFGFGEIDLADDLDAALLRAFPDDKKLLDELVEHRLEWGLVVSARALIERSGRDEKTKQRIRFLAGSRSADDVPAVVTAPQASRLFLPLMLAGSRDQAMGVLQRVTFDGVNKEDLSIAPLLVGVAIYHDDADAALRFGRHWLRALIKHNEQGYLPGLVTRVLQETWSVLEDEHRKSLAHSLVDAALADPKKSGQLLALIADLQKKLEVDLVDADQVRRLVKEGSTVLTYQPAPLVEMVPVEQREEVMREIWDKVPQTQQPRFLLYLVEGLREPCPPGIAAFVKREVKQRIAKFREDMNTYIVAHALLNNRYNPELALELALLLYEKNENDALFMATYAGALATVQRLDEARELAAQAHVSWLESGDEKFQVQNALNRLQPALGIAGMDRTIRALAEYEKKKGPSTRLTTMRLGLIQARDDPEALLAALRDAVEKHPDDLNLVNRLNVQLRARGLPVEAAELLERTLEKHPKNKDYRNRAASAWESLRHPLRAERVLKGGEKKKRKRDESARKVEPASVAEVKKALDKEEAGRARTIFRRMWRGLRPDRADRRFYFPPGYAMRNLLQQYWPVEPDPQRKRSRGGLPESFDKTEEEEEKEREEQQAKRRHAYEVIAGHEFGRREIQRQLRTLSEDDLDRAGRIFRAIARGEDVQRLLEGVRSGGAGKREYALLLQALETAPDALGDQTAPVLRDVAATVNPYDTDQGRRLARVYAAQKEPDKAERLYRWAATQLNAESDWYARVSPDELVNECCKHLEGEHRLRAVEAVMRVAMPQIHLGLVFDNRDYNYALTLRTWLRVLGPDGAFEKCRTICEETASKATVMRRQTARQAAPLFARRGEHEKALRALENALWRREREELDDELPPWYGYYNLRAQSIGYRDLRRLFPMKADVTWLGRAATAFRSWLEADRVRRDNALQALALIVLRLHEAGEKDAADQWFAYLEKSTGADPRMALWVADLARRRGDEKKADSIERRLLARRVLHTERVPEVVQRTLKAGDAGAALELGEAAAAYTHHPDLVRHLVAAAEGAGKPDRAAHWREVQAELEELKRKREAKSKAGG